MTTDEKTTSEQFALELRTWRKRAHLTQEQAAVSLGAKLDTYRHWEQARHLPPDHLRFLVRRLIVKQQ